MMNSSSTFDARAALQKLGLPLLAGLALGLCFIGAYGFALHDPEPHDLPVAVVGAPQAQSAISTALAQHAPGAFSITAYASPDAAIAALRDQTVVGVYVTSRTSSPTIVVAGANGQAVTAAVTNAFQGVAQANGQTASVQDIAPLPTADRQGLTTFFLLVGTILASFVFQVLLSVLAKGVPTAFRFGTMALFAVLLGLSGAVIVDPVLGALPNHFWQLVGMISLLSLAVTGVSGACQQLLGNAGTGLAALIVLIVGLSTTGGPIGTLFLPDAFRTIAPWLPAAAMLSALRSVIYFSNTDVTAPLLTTGAWAVGGYGIAVLGAWLSARRGAAPTIPAAVSAVSPTLHP